MKKTVLFAAVVLFVLSAGSHSFGQDTVRSPGQHPQSLEKTVTKTVRIKYLLYLPEGYENGDKKWPLMLFLHGAGERGDDLELVKMHGPPKLVAEGQSFPFIIVSPQCPENSWWTYEMETLVLLLDEIATQYRVDRKRVYLTGLSMGGYGTWSLATRYPERFAAIAPICGDGTPYLAHRLKDVPAWVFHGAKDEVVSIRNSEDMVAAIRKNKGSARYTMYPNYGHNSWTQTYKNPELYKWFLSQSR